MSQTIPSSTDAPAHSPNGQIVPTHETMPQRAQRILGGVIHDEDYLPMTDEVRQSLALSEAFIRTEKKGELVGEARSRHTQDLLLDFHHGGQMVAAYRTDRGVVVMATNDEIREFLDSLTNEQRLKVCIEFPDIW